uniref:Uncharacterized protein n=1 Tax=Anguilla anguilla TaxID=7936 RepID=A0A0E9V2C2_ANGAN
MPTFGELAAVLETEIKRPCKLVGDTIPHDTSRDAEVEQLLPCSRPTLML